MSRKFTNLFNDFAGAIGTMDNELGYNTLKSNIQSPQNLQNTNPKSALRSLAGDNVKLNVSMQAVSTKVDKNGPNVSGAVLDNKSQLSAMKSEVQGVKSTAAQIVRQAQADIADAGKKAGINLHQALPNADSSTNMLANAVTQSTGLNTISNVYTLLDDRRSAGSGKRAQMIQQLKDELIAQSKPQDGTAEAQTIDMPDTEISKASPDVKLDWETFFENFDDDALITLANANPDDLPENLFPEIKVLNAQEQAIDNSLEDLALIEIETQKQPHNISLTQIFNDDLRNEEYILADIEDYPSNAVGTYTIEEITMWTSTLDDARLATIETPNLNDDIRMAFANNKAPVTSQNIEFDITKLNQPTSPIMGNMA